MIALADYCRIVDLREAPTDELQQRLLVELEATEQDSLLWSARRPKKRWHLGLSAWKPLLLTTAPQFEQILWLRPGTPRGADERFAQECRTLLDDYEGLFDGDPQIEACPKFQAYSALLTAHIENQESQTFPRLLELLPLERVARELGYEHQGLLRGLGFLPDILRRARTGTLEKRERERIDLDFYHLLEHHLERELDALSPALVFLEGVYRT